jgi:hypothetical protein
MEKSIKNESNDNIIEIKYIDLCCGIGGFRIGIDMFQKYNPNILFDCVYSADIKKDAIKTYNVNFNENIEPLDIYDIEIENIPEFDLLCAGFPCQSFSSAAILWIKIHKQAISRPSEFFTSKTLKLLDMIANMLIDYDILYCLHDVRSYTQLNETKTIKYIAQLMNNGCITSNSQGFEYKHEHNFSVLQIPYLSCYISFNKFNKIVNYINHNIDLFPYIMCEMVYYHNDEIHGTQIYGIETEKDMYKYGRIFNSSIVNEYYTFRIPLTYNVQSNELLPLDLFHHTTVENIPTNDYYELEIDGICYDSCDDDTDSFDIALSKNLLNGNWVYSKFNCIFHNENICNLFWTDLVKIFQYS